MPRHLEKLGTPGCVFVHTAGVPAFLSWCMEHLPEAASNHRAESGLVGQAPACSSQIIQQSCPVVCYCQRRGIQQYFLKHGLDMILVGHRKADGNFVGKGSNILTNGAGVTRYSPLAEWPHELVLAYIHYNNIPLPPIYGWKDGFRCGTHPWPARSGMKSIDEGWADIYDIDPSIIEVAAAKIESAAHFLKEVRS